MAPSPPLSSLDDRSLLSSGHRQPREEYRWTNGYVESFEDHVLKGSAVAWNLHVVEICSVAIQRFDRHRQLW
jgi:hypothetical protein